MNTNIPKDHKLHKKISSDAVLSFALLIAIVGCIFDESFFRTINYNLIFETLSAKIPMISIFSRYSKYHEYAKTIAFIEWLFVPAYLFLFAKKLPYWKEGVTEKFWSNIKSAQRSMPLRRLFWIWLGIICIFFMIFSDLFNFPFFGIYGCEWLEKGHQAPRIRTFLSIKPLTGVFVGCACFFEAYIYFVASFLSWSAICHFRRRFFINR